MANIYDGVFRTILNDRRKLIIPVINEIFQRIIYRGGRDTFFFLMNILWTNRMKRTGSV